MPDHDHQNSMPSTCNYSLVASATTKFRQRDLPYLPPVGAPCQHCPDPFFHRGIGRGRLLSSTAETRRSHSPLGTMGSTFIVWRMRATSRLIREFSGSSHKLVEHRRCCYLRYVVSAPLCEVAGSSRIQTARHGYLRGDLGGKVGTNSWVR